MRRFAARVLLLGLSLGLVPAVASAGDGAAEKDQARVLAREAADQLDEKKYAEALDKASRAEALYHAPYHVFVMASALEGLGRLKEAAQAYERLVAEPLPASAPKIFRDAQETGKTRLRELVARIPTVLVQVRGASKDEAKATLDGESVDLASGVAMRADPGKHVLRVTAEGRRPFEETVTLPEKGGVVVVEASLEPLTTASTRPPDAPDNANRGGSLVPALVAFGVGGIGLIVGGTTGAMELDRVRGLSERCPNNICAPTEQAELDGARQLATISTVGFVMGGVGAVTGAVLLVLRKKPAPQKPVGFQMTPWVGIGSAGVTGVY